MFISKLKRKFDTNEPIFTNEILDLFSEYSRAYVFRLIKKAEQKGEIINFEKGIYYIPTSSIIGNSTISVEDVVYKKYMSYNGEVFGLFSGLYLQNAFSITTQMANTIEVVTNSETTRCRKINICGRDIILRKSRCEITIENVKAYAIIQLLSEFNKNVEFGENVKKIIWKYIQDNSIKYKDLLSVAKYFPAKVLKKLLNNEVFYELA